MKEIHDFLLENMPVPAQRECLHEVHEATNGCEYVKTNMQHVWETFSAAYLYMERIYQIPIGSNLITEDIVALDNIRDRMVNAIDAVVDAQKKSPDTDVAAAARDLEQTKTSFPVDTRKGYLYQTGQLDTYLTVMLGAQLENTTKVGILSLIQALKSINDQIHALVAERGEENVDKVQDMSRPAARERAVNAWRAMVKYINGYNIVVLGPTGSNAELDRYIDTCNDIGDRYRSIYLGGAGNVKPGEESEEDSENSEDSEDSESSEENTELDPALNITIKFKNENNQLVHEMVVPVDYQIPESEFPTPPEGTHWNFTLADLNLAIGMKNPGDTITVRAQA